MRSYPNAAGGVKLILYAQVLAILAIALAFIPVVGPVLAVLAGVAVLVGLSKASADDSGYHAALVLNVANIVVNVVSAFFSGRLVGSILSIVSALLSMAVLYLVCTTTGNLLYSKGQNKLSDMGRLVWLINLACTVVSVVLSILMLLPVIRILAALLSVVLALVEVLGLLLYMYFLYKSSQVL